MLVFRIDDLMNKSLLLGGGKQGDKRKVEKDMVESSECDQKRQRRE